MAGFNSGHWEGEVSGMELGPDALNIKVSYGLNEHVVSVPSGFNFGNLKSVIAKKLGLAPERHKILFRGKEKADGDKLQTSGLKNGSKVLLMEDNSSCMNESVNSALEPRAFSKGDEAVALVSQEVDSLSVQVSALQCVVDNNTKVDDKDVVYVTEMLMRQLLKLDGIEAEGEGKAKRKSEVRRVQSLVDTMDSLKLKNSKPVTSATQDGNAPITTQWETFEIEPPSDATRPVYPAPAFSSSPAPVSFEPVPRYPSSVYPTPAFASTPASVPLQPVAEYSSSGYPMPAFPSYPNSIPYYTPAFPPQSYHSSGQPMQYFVPNSYPVEYYPMAPSSVQPSPEVTREWEHFE